MLLKYSELTHRNRFLVVYDSMFKKDLRNPKEYW